VVQKLVEADYHRARALRELDAGLGASCWSSARVHLRLSTLRMQRARELGAALPPPPLSM